MIWFDRRLDSANVRINTWQAVSNNNAASFSSAKISTQDWDPNQGFFTSGAFIGDYNGLAASTDAVYAVWTDGRDDAIGQTGLGETDIFTSVQNGRRPSRKRSWPRPRARATTGPSAEAVDLQTGSRRSAPALGS